jgi:hypothetical protein
MLLDQSEDSTGRTTLDLLYSNLRPGNILGSFTGSTSEESNGGENEEGNGQSHDD